MRIITGKARGTRLETLEGLNTRPTSERTKEAVFSMLQFEIEGRAVLDLFAGSGQMALEALSRGARVAYAVERSKSAAQTVTKNAEKCRLKESCRIYCEDSSAFLKRHGDGAFDIVFLDPPYATDLLNESLSLLFERGLVKETSYIVCESDSFDWMNEKNGENFEIIKTMKHGIAHILVLRLRGGAEE